VNHDASFSFLLFSLFFFSPVFSLFFSSPVFSLFFSSPVFSLFFFFSCLFFSPFFFFLWRFQSCAFLLPPCVSCLAKLLHARSVSPTCEWRTGSTACCSSWACARDCAASPSSSSSSGGSRLGSAVEVVLLSSWLRSRDSGLIE